MKEKILILGGTEFVGRLLVEELEKDDTKEIFLFNRGKTNPDIFPKIKRIIGDRETDDIKKIKAHKWDYIVDFSSYYPASLKKTLEHINRDVKKYIYISTISVYALTETDLNKKIKEEHKKLTCTPAEAVDKTMKTYGKKKVACENILHENDWLNSIILRPSIIYGKHDPTDRFYYWLWKIKNSREIIVPNKGEDKLSLTYAEDLVKIIANGINGEIPNGIYNCSTLEPLSYNHLLSSIKKTTGSKCSFFYVDYQKLREKKIRVPLAFIKNIWIDNEKIKSASDIQFTPLKASLQAMIEFYEKEGWHQPKIGVSQKEEKEFIEKYQSK